MCILRALHQAPGGFYCGGKRLIELNHNFDGRLLNYAAWRFQVTPFLSLTIGLYLPRSLRSFFIGGGVIAGWFMLVMVVVMLLCFFYPTPILVCILVKLNRYMLT